MERTLVATTPAAMEAAQTQMIAWSKAKGAEVSRELQTLREELAIAKRNHWPTGPIDRRIRREGNRLNFYAKIRRALEDGFYVVPNFGGDAFAIRTNAKKPKSETTLYHIGLRDFTQPVPMLPKGKGRYVAAQASGIRIEDRVGKDGESRSRQFRAHELVPVEFPVSLMKPEAMEATERAMALKVFDEILEARDQMRCGDPMILGRIRNPWRGRPDVTFFIAWVMPLDRI